MNSPQSRRFRMIASGAAVLALAITASACGSANNGNGSNSSEAARMALSNGFGGGGPTDDFVAGLNCYAEKNGLNNPAVTTADGDVNTQLSDIDSLIARGGKFDGIFVLPADPSVLRPAYDRALSAGIAVIDPISQEPDGSFLTNATAHVAPDDLGVPKMIVDYLSDEHAGAKNVVILSPQPGQSMSDNRSNNFQEAAKAKGMTILGEIHSEKLSTEDAQEKMENFLTQHRDTEVVFSQNGAMARGAALAAKSQGIDLVIVSLDNDPATINAVIAGDIQASFGSDLFAVAYEASEQAAAFKSGGDPENIAVPYTVYTKGNAEIITADTRCNEY